MKTLKILAVFATVIAVSAFMIHHKGETIVLRGHGIGDIATDFKLKNVDNQLVSISDYKNDKGVILVFTCNHCPYSKAYEDRIIALDQEFKVLGYPVIAINPNNPDSYSEDSFEAMKVRAKEKGFTFPYLLDEGQKIYPQYGATKTPHVYILQNTKAGHIVRYIGAIDNNYKNATLATAHYVWNAVNELLEGKEVSLAITKAIGCSIKD